jgi:ubiquinone biosynthesis protein
VLVLERIQGVKIDDLAALDDAGFDRHQIALNSALIIVKEILEDGFFHADPHPGNFAIMPGEVIGAMDFGMVGHLSHQDRVNLIRLYGAAIQLDTKRVVKQLTRMGAVTSPVDGSALEREISRLLAKYQGLPLKDIRAQEVIGEVMAIAFRHHLHLPRDMWLLIKTLAMMEGIGLNLDPEFDIFAVSEPFALRMMRELWKPGVWGPTLLNNLEAWGEMLSSVPQSGARLLQSLEKGNLPVSLNFQVVSEDNLARLDGIANRLSLSILTAALIMGLALVVPAFGGEGWMQALVIIGFAGVIVFGIWLLITFLRTRH